MRPEDPPLDDERHAVMLADPRRALAWAATLLLVGGALCVLVWITAARARLQWADDQFLDLMVRARVAPLTACARAFAFIGGAWVTWIVRTAVVAVLARRRHWVHLTAFLAAAVTSEALIGPLKAVYERPRPAGSLIATSGSSFPSGHAIAGAVTAVGLVIVLLPPGHMRWSWERRAALYASLMALSRAYLGAHWLSDVVTGALLGSGLALAWPAALVLWRARVVAGREGASP